MKKLYLLGLVVLCFATLQAQTANDYYNAAIAVRVKKGIPQGNMVVFSAAQGDETPYPNKEQQHGMFTYYLLKKLQETKGEVSYSELGDYIIQEVRQQSIVLNGKSQTPTVIPSYSVGDAWKTWTMK